jgi:nicotinamide-nucleotide adenylyltransferase
MLFKERKIETIHPPLIKRENLSATEVRYRIANDIDWKDLVSLQTAKIIEEIKGIERIKDLYSLKVNNH